MVVIAMTREMGSGGREVAQRAAEEMGLALVLHEVIERDLARRLDVPETAIHRRFEGGAALLERWRVGAGAWRTTRRRRSIRWRSVATC
jgi:Cytidylate kinase-like family